MGETKMKGFGAVILKPDDWILKQVQDDGNNV